MPALELAVLTKCEYAKPRKPAGNNTELEMCDPARWGNRGDARGGERKFSLMHLVTGALGKQPRVAKCGTDSITSPMTARTAAPKTLRMNGAARE